MPKQVVLLLQDDVPADEGSILFGQSQVSKCHFFPFMHHSSYSVCLSEPHAALVMIVLKKQESTERFQ